MNDTLQKTIQVIIVDDHQLVREGIASRLQLNEKISICAQASSGLEACKLAESLDPDIIFMDISMPDMNGLEAAKRILSIKPEAKILFLSIYDNPEYIREAISIGAKGYLLKDVSAEEMMTSLLAVYKGGTYLSSKVAFALSSSRETETDDKYNLTLREKQVLKLIASGKANKEIAESFSISVRTVESHRMSIREKTGGGNAATLSIIAQELKLLI
ncbi:MAG: response regulator transcription factor [Salaquimonas sp.]